MFVRVDKDFNVSFEDTGDFKKFHIEVQHGQDALGKVSEALKAVAAVDDAEHGWVYESALREWEGMAGDQAFQDGFSDMLEKVKPHGWYDEERKAIQAHIEWAG